MVFVGKVLPFIERKQFVIISGKNQQLNYSSTVLFILYVNDLYATILRSNNFLFADDDDTGLVNCNNNLKTIEKHLNQDLRSLINGFVLVVYL